MTAEVYAGAADGVWRLRRGDVALEGQAVRGLTARADEVWALAGDAVVRLGDPGAAVSLEGLDATCIAISRNGPLAGTEEAHLYELAGGSPSRIESFERVAGRGDWYTPWGGPPAVRSLAETAGGDVLVNVHVGGIARSGDGGASWAPTIDVDTDVHQVIAHPDDARIALAATGVGYALSNDGGRTWRIDNDGLDVVYCRSVALAGDTVLVGASSSHTGKRAALYRRPMDASAPFERCTGGLPDFSGNIDTHRLAAAGDTAALATPEGSIYVSDDGGKEWSEAAKGLVRVRAVLIA